VKRLRGGGTWQQVGAAQTKKGRREAGLFAMLSLG
jgi:hypothetical protein